MKTETMQYQDQGTTFHAFCASDPSKGNPKSKPAVLICHDYTGLNDFARNKAKELAELGYFGFAIDMYGEGKTGADKEEKTALMTPLTEDRALLRHRISKALSVLKTLEGVDTQRIAAIGFCFGGLCVLDLARSGADLQGVISFHGLLKPAEKISNASIKAKVLVLHGYEDPMVPPAQFKAFADEMTESKVDWEINVYGNTKHGFMNPQVNDEASGIVYNANVAPRAWLAMQDFLKELFT